MDSRSEAEPIGDYRLIAGGQVTATSGRHGLTDITVTTGGTTQTVTCDTLAMSGGWNPSVHLTCHLNARPLWRRDLLAFVPAAGAVPGMRAVGACNGSFSTQAALTEGAAAADAVLDELGMGGARSDVPVAEDAPYQIAPLWAVPGKGRAWLDFQNDVTVKDVTQAAGENFRSVEHMKRYTTQGMATDQGKNSNVAALAVLADVTGRSIPETGTTTFRPPFVPVSIGAMGAGAADQGFKPRRFLTSHGASEERGASQLEVGLWYRAAYFPKQGESNWRQSCDREVMSVRRAVGVCDVSTLGKIDIQGPDAAKLLDFVYTNTFSTLKVGRVRYGLMLREDGHVMDDGTCARLGEQHFVMTTTTAAGTVNNAGGTITGDVSTQAAVTNNSAGNIQGTVTSTAGIITNSGGGQINSSGLVTDTNSVGGNVENDTNGTITGKCDDKGVFRASVSLDALGAILRREQAPRAFVAHVGRRWGPVLGQTLEPVTAEGQLAPPPAEDDEPDEPGPVEGGMNTPTEGD